MGRIRKKSLYPLTKSKSNNLQDTCPVPIGTSTSSAPPIAFADDVTFVIEGDTRRQIEQLRINKMHMHQDWASEKEITISSQNSKLLF